MDGHQRRLKSLETAEEHAQQLQAQVLRERQALQACQLALQQEQERASKTATAQELQKLISSLQEERKSSQAKLAKQDEREQRIAAANSGAHAAAAKVKVGSSSPWGTHRKPQKQKGRAALSYRNMSIICFTKASLDLLDGRSRF